MTPVYPFRTSKHCPKPQGHQQDRLRLGGGADSSISKGFGYKAFAQAMVNCTITPNVHVDPESLSLGEVSPTPLFLASELDPEEVAREIRGLEEGFESARRTPPSPSPQYTPIPRALTGLFLGSHPCPDGAPNQWQRHDTGGWSRPRVADGGRQVGNSNQDLIPNIHQRRRALSRHRKGQSQGLRERRGPPAPGPSPRAGRRGPH